MIVLLGSSSSRNGRFFRLHQDHGTIISSDFRSRVTGGRGKAATCWRFETSNLCVPGAVERTNAVYFGNLGIIDTQELLNK